MHKLHMDYIFLYIQPVILLKFLLHFHSLQCFLSYLLYIAIHIRFLEKSIMRYHIHVFQILNLHNTTSSLSKV